MPELPVGATRRLRAGPRPPACLCCGAALTGPFADLGLAPLGEAPLAPEAAEEEAFAPLRVMACEDCRLVQRVGAASAGRADGPATGPGPAAVARMLDLPPEAAVVEIGSGAGGGLIALLQRGHPVLGIEPCGDAAAQAEAAGVPTEQAAFGTNLARRLRAEGEEPALVCLHGALATTDDPHDLLAGLRLLLAPGGVASISVPYLLPMLRDARFDAIRHGRKLHLSLLAAETLLLQHGLVAVEATERPEEGGTLHLLLRHAEDAAAEPGPGVEALRRREAGFGLGGPEPYAAFGPRVVEAKCALLDFLVGVRRAGRSVAGWGAVPGASTLLRYCGVGPELLPWIADPNPALRGRLLAGCRIPIRPAAALLQERPDFVLVLPWMERDEALRTLPALRRWGGRLALPLPILEIV